MKSYQVRPGQELVFKIAAGDQRAFQTLYTLYYRRLCQFAFLLLKSKELSEEAVSDVFFNIWMKKERLTSVSNIESYLYMAVRNQSIDYLRSDMPYRTEQVDAFLVELISTDPTTDETIEQEELQQTLQRAIYELPERCRIILRMYLNDQLPYKEIAEILNISRKTVEAQIAIATRKLKEILKPSG